VAALLAAGANPNGASHSLPLKAAAAAGRTGCVSLLLAAGADPAARRGQSWTALHAAAYCGQAAVVRQLLRAHPAGALVRTNSFGTPLQVALGFSGFAARAQSPLHFEAARCLLAEGALQLAGELLALLNMMGALALPLYATVVARQPLMPAEWALVPLPCPSMGAALPAVLERSVEEAALLVGHLPVADRQRLQAAALCLAQCCARQQASLPVPIMWHILALSAA